MIISINSVYVQVRKPFCRHENTLKTLFITKSYQSTSSNTFKPPAVYSCIRCKYTKRSLLYS